MSSTRESRVSPPGIGALRAGRPAGRRADAELRMARLRDRHESILQSAGEGIFGLDLEGRATFANDAAARALGCRVDELVGRPMHETVHHSRPGGAPYPVAECPIHATLRDDAVHRVEDEVFWRSDGSSFPVEYTSTPIREDGRVVGAVVLFADISERVRGAAELRESERRFRGLAAEHAALGRVAVAVAAEVAPEELFALVAGELTALVDAEAARVVRLDAPAHDAERGAVARVRVEGRPAAWRGDGRSEVAAPVWVGSTLWGCVVAERAGGFPDGTEERLVHFAELVGMGIVNIEGRDRIVAETAAAILQGRLDMDATLRAVAEAAQRAMGSDRASCFVHDGPDDEVGAVYTTASDPRERAFLEGTVGMPAARLPICRLLAEQPDPVLAVEDVVGNDRIHPKLAAKLGSAAFVGLRLEHGSVRTEGEPALLGTLFMSFRRPQRFSPRALTAARSLGGLAALAIANARLHAQTLSSLAQAENRAATDPLTGLANHRIFHQALRAHVERAQAGGRPLGLVVLDLDHFKQVNDAHGHQAGDVVLRDVGDRLRALARGEDLVARIGGEEFALLLPETDAQGALAAAERARAAIGDRDFCVGPITASAGVCELAAAGSADELLGLADGALYWAKAHGRDVAIPYSPEVVTDLSAEERAERLERGRALAGLRALARAVDAKDPATRRHSERVAHMAVRLATVLGWSHARTALLNEAGLLHDVGKIGVPDAVLFKPGRLTPDEYEQVKQHAALGATIADDVLAPEQVAWVRHHHERWDGGGYPDALAGAASPEGAQILALADAWDVMTSHRSYKRPFRVQEALADCREQSGRQFAPAVVEALMRLSESSALEEPADGPDALAGLSSVVFDSFSSACRQVLEELRLAMGWEQAFLTRVHGPELEVVAVSGGGPLTPGLLVPVTETFCHTMLAGDAPPACGRMSDPGSAYHDVPVRAALGAEAYSGHPVVLPDGSVYGTLCVLDRTPRDITDAGRRMGVVLARLLAWELQREGLSTALGRARLEVAATSRG